MIADGVFEGPIHRERVELIEGEIRRMSPIGPPHEDVVDLVSLWSFESVPRDTVRVRNQASVGLPELESVPQPDVAWVRARRYSRKRPTSSDVLLIIEVADSSLRYDRGPKARLYATAGIADYWVVDINNCAVHVYRQPAGGVYGTCETFRGTDRVRPHCLPDVELVVEALFTEDDVAEAAE
jgi:Uma2 family endonuclease